MEPGDFSGLDKASEQELLDVLSLRKNRVCRDD
jgi:hypothetical protein